MSILEIPMPTICSRWQSFFNGKSNSLASQIVNLQVSYHTNTLEFQIEQSVDVTQHRDVASFIKTPIELHVETLNGDGTPIYGLTFTQLTTLEHNYKFDYASSSCLMHKIKMSFGRFDTVSSLKKI